MKELIDTLAKMSWGGFIGALTSFLLEVVGVLKFRNPIPMILWMTLCGGIIILNDQIKRREKKANEQMS